MKNLLTLLLTFAMALGVMADVPSLINYQGKLSDESGNPVNGTKAFSIKIYDAKTEGKEIYQEEIGNVALRNGIYSFGFGEAGKSVSTATETIGFTDGEKQVFNYTVKNTPVLGETKISASDYSWTENGSSDATKFTATENKSSGAISAIFIAGVPDFGEQILISYDHHSDGVMGALSRGGQAWLELIVDNKPMSPRERLVTVPFALRAGISEELNNRPERVLLNVPNIKLESQGWMKSGRGPYGVWFPNYLGGSDKIDFYSPKDAKKIIIRLNDGVMDYSRRPDQLADIPGTPRIIAELRNPDNNSEPEAVFKRIGIKEFHLENPPSGWRQITFKVMPLSNYGSDHYFISGNRLVILAK